MTPAQYRDALLPDLALPRPPRHGFIRSQQASVGYGGYAIKLLRLQNEMIQTFDRYRRGNKQTVEVRHVHIHSGGQGVVGIINPPDDREGDG